MAKKEDKKVKKPAKTPAKEVKKAEKPTKEVAVKTQPKQTEKHATTTVKKSDIAQGEKRQTQVIKKPQNRFAKKPKKVKETKFEEKKDLDKLYVYFTIVNSGVADSVVKVFEDMGCSASFIQNGTGTASEEVKKALHIQDSRKEVVISIIRESRLEDIEKELAAFFLAARRNKGIAFATKMDAIQGVRLYKFLSQTL